MFSERQILILKQLPRVGRKTILKLGSSVDTGMNDDYAFKKFAIEALSGIKIVISNETYNEAVNKADYIIESSEKSKIKLFGYWSHSYPGNFKDLSDPPVLVSVAGNHTILNEKKTVAIIGTREPSDFGYKSGKRLSELFTKEGFIVVSGLAKGCDTAAHVGCLESNGQTISVLAHGLDMIYPSQNKSLAFEIVNKGGALISEYEIFQKPLSNFFVERDRLQSGLSGGIVVIETDIKGGTMHTVKYAQEQSKLLACLSHPEKYSQHDKANGNKYLIKEGKAMPIGSNEELKTFIDTFYKKYDILVEITNEYQSLPFSETLFAIDDFIVNEPSAETRKIKRTRKKKGEKGTQTSYQAIIWE